MAKDPEWFSDDDPLNRRFALYLPSRRENGSSINNLRLVSKAAGELLCDLFGGVTSYPAGGWFRGESGTVQGEDVLVFETFCSNEDWRTHSKTIKRLAALLAVALSQEAIACSLDGRMMLVKSGMEFTDNLPAPLTGLADLAQKISAAPTKGDS